MSPPGRRVVGLKPSIKVPSVPGLASARACVSTLQFLGTATGSPEAYTLKRVIFMSPSVVAGGAVIRLEHKSSTPSLL